MNVNAFPCERHAFQTTGSGCLEFSRRRQEKRRSTLIALTSGPRERSRTSEPLHAQASRKISIQMITLIALSRLTASERKLQKQEERKNNEAASSLQKGDQTLPLVIALPLVALAIT